MSNNSERGLNVLIHGLSGSGKTTLASTSPKPLLFIDSENTSRFLRQKKVTWNPLKNAAPPEYIEDQSDPNYWEICVVKARNWETIKKTSEFLNRREHSFKSVVLDSVTEAQDKLIQEIVPDGETPTMRDWGTLGAMLKRVLRDLRDTIEDEETPLEIVVLVSATKESVDDFNNKSYAPILQGSTKDILPFLQDLVCYLYITHDSDGVETRALYTANNPDFNTKNRIPGDVVPAAIPNPNLSELLDLIFPDGEAPAFTIDNN